MSFIFTFGTLAAVTAHSYTPGSRTGTYVLHTPLYAPISFVKPTSEITDLDHGFVVKFNASSRKRMYLSEDGNVSSSLADAPITYDDVELPEEVIQEFMLGQQTKLIDLSEYVLRIDASDHDRIVAVEELLTQKDVPFFKRTAENDNALERVDTPNLCIFSVGGIPNLRTKIGEDGINGSSFREYYSQHFSM